MPKLVIKSGDLAGAAFELAAGVNRVGRNPENDVAIPDGSISSFHCELHVAEIGVSVRDLDSTNGTFINRQRIQRGMLQTDDRLILGEVELAVELPEVKVALPELDFQGPLPAAFLEDGTPACYTHRDVPALFRCTRCEDAWCAGCVRQLKRLSGSYLQFCPQCSAACVPISSGPGAARKSFLRRVTESLGITPKQ